jgi:hypothetical protein
MYSGSKDGVVKIWSVQSQTIMEDGEDIDDLYLRQVG